MPTLHATSQDGLSQEFVAATAGRECNIQYGCYNVLKIWRKRINNQMMNYEAVSRTAPATQRLLIT